MVKQNLSKIKFLLLFVVGFVFILSIAIFYLFSGNYLKEGLKTNVFSSFDDVPESYKYAKTIWFLKDYGVIDGYPDGTFKPENTLNRAEFAKIIVLGTGQEPMEADKPPFPDVPLGEWYTNFIYYCAYWDYVDGYPDGTFKPEQQINKVEALKILGELVGWELDSVNIDTIVNPYSDVDLDEWYGPYLAYAIDRNLLDDSGPSFGASTYVTRGQMTEYLYRDYVVRELGVDRYEYDYDVEIFGFDPRDGNQQNFNFSSNGISYSEGSTNESEYKSVVEFVNNEIIDNHEMKSQLIAFLEPIPYAAGSTLAAYDFTSITGQSDSEILENDSWIVFIDLYPSAGWAHSTEFVIIDADTLEYKVRTEEFWPVIDGISLWSTADMRGQTDFWVYPGPEEIDRLITNNSSEEFSNKYLTASTSFAANPPELSVDDFVSSCPCDGETNNKIALIIEGMDEASWLETGKDEIEYSNGVMITNLITKWDSLPLYKGLVSQGFDTTYVSGEFKEDLSNIPEGVDPDDARYTTLPNISQAFADLAAKIESCCDEVVVVFSGHGTGFEIDFNSRRYIPQKNLVRKIKEDGSGYYWDWEPMEPLAVGSDEGGDLNVYQMRDYLNSLNTCKVSVIISACHSGGLLSGGSSGGINSQLGEGCSCRIIYTSSSTEGLTWEGEKGLLSQSGKGLQNGDSLVEALYNASISASNRGERSNFVQIGQSSTEYCEDYDGDGYCTGKEIARGMDPYNTDTDGDGLSDAEEWDYDPSVSINDHTSDHITDPVNPDTDEDKLSDGVEREFGTNPFDTDTDDDDASDWHEWMYKTDPLNPDTDNDGCTDGREMMSDYTNPKDPEDHAIDCSKDESVNICKNPEGDPFVIEGHTLDFTYVSGLNADIDIDGELHQLNFGESYALDDEFQITLSEPDDSGNICILVEKIENEDDDSYNFIGTGVSPD